MTCQWPLTWRHLLRCHQGWHHQGWRHQLINYAWTWPLTWQMTSPRMTSPAYEPVSKNEVIHCYAWATGKPLFPFVSYRNLIMSDAWRQQVWRQTWHPNIPSFSALTQNKQAYIKYSLYILHVTIYTVLIMSVFNALLIRQNSCRMHSFRYSLEGWRISRTRRVSSFLGPSISSPPARL